MKPLYPITRPAPALLLAVIIAGLILLTCQCTTYQEVLTEPTSENRNIIGYEQGKVFKKRIYYKVTDSRGNPAMRIYKHRRDTLRPIGGIFIIEQDYTYQD